MNDEREAADRILKGARAYRDGQHSQQGDIQHHADKPAGALPSGAELPTHWGHWTKPGCGSVWVRDDGHWSVIDEGNHVLGTYHDPALLPRGHWHPATATCVTELEREVADLRAAAKAQQEIINDVVLDGLAGDVTGKLLLEQLRNTEQRTLAAEKRVAELEAELAKVREWQPIDTAPKDGKWIALWSQDGGVSVGYWGPTYFDSDYAWVRYHHRSDSEEVRPVPTHWRPLPQPPAPQQTKE